MAAVEPFTDVFVFFPKRVGWRWEVWQEYADKHPDPANGATEWKALWSFRFWRWINAARAAADLQRAYNSGMAAGEALDLLDGVHAP